TAAAPAPPTVAPAAPPTAALATPPTVAPAAPPTAALATPPTPTPTPAALPAAGPAHPTREWRAAPRASPRAVPPDASPAATASAAANRVLGATTPTAPITISITSTLREGNLVVKLDDVPVFNEKFQKPALLISQTTTWDPVVVVAGQHRLSAEIRG